jgi:hypothetical protein
MYSMLYGSSAAVAVCDNKCATYEFRVLAYTSWTSVDWSSASSAVAAARQADNAKRIAIHCMKKATPIIRR